MNTNRIMSFSDLHEQCQQYDKEMVIYRGVKDFAKDKLIPKIGRKEIIGSRDVFNEEQIVLRFFKERSRPYLPFVPNNDWEWLALAQHHGLPTRLLDWTSGDWSR